MRNVLKPLFIAGILLCCIKTKTFAAYTYSWTGGTSTAWELAANWSRTGTGGTSTYPGQGGSTTDIVQVGVNSTFYFNQPTLSTSVTVASVTIGCNETTTLTINAALTLTGDFTQKNNSNGGGSTTNLTGTGSISCNNFYAGDSTLPPVPILGLANQAWQTIINFTTLTLNVSQNLYLTTTASKTSLLVVLVAVPSADVDNPFFYFTSGTITVGNAIQTVDSNDADVAALLIFGRVSSSAEFLVNPSTGNTSVLNLNGANPVSLDGQGGYVDFYGTAGGQSTVNYGGTINQEVYTTSTPYAFTRQYPVGLDRSTSIYQNISFSGSATKTSDNGNLTVGNNFTVSPGSETVDLAANSPIVTIGGILTTGAGSTIKQGGTGTMSVTGVTNNSGTINQTGTGNITFTGTVTNVTASSIISQSSSGSITALAGINNSGNITQLTGETGAINITGTLVNSGAVTQTGGNISVSGTTTNSGTISQTAGGNITFTGAVNNSTASSVISQSSTGSITASAGITNSGNITQATGETGAINITGTFLNSGTLTQTGGNVIVTGDVTNSGTLGLGTANLSISSNYTNSGTYTQSTGTTIFTGASAQTLQGGSGAGTKFNKVNFSGAGIKSMTTGNFSVSTTGILTMVGSASSLNAGGILTLLSDANSSATVAAIPAGAIINGNVNVQRFLTGGTSVYRGYRLMSSPVNNGSGIYSINYLINFAYLSGTTGTAGGFDKTGNPTVYLYRENLAPQYTTFLNSNFRGINSLTSSPTYPIDQDAGTFNIPVGNGYLFFFRGNRASASLATETVTTYVPQSATFTATGVLNQGQVTVKDWYTPASSNLGYTLTTGNSAVRGFNLIGNPYASSIDWDTFSGTSSSAPIYGPSVTKFIYVFDVQSKNYGVYGAGSGGLGTNNATNIISSGLGFFVRDTCACSQLIIKESAKVNTQATGFNLLMTARATGISTTNNNAVSGHLRLRMAMDSINIDEVIVSFRDSAKVNYSPDEDALYKSGQGEVSLASITPDNHRLSINELPLPKRSPQVIPLAVSARTDGIYHLNMKDMTNVPSKYEVWLMDSYRRDSLDMRLYNTYAFNIYQADTASSGSNRFRLIIRENPDSLYRLLNFAASKMNNAIQVKLSWATQAEQNYTDFIVQRSVDSGKTYQVIGTVISNGQGSYNMLDKNPLMGQNIYRLQQQNMGDISYSKPVSIFYSNNSNTVFTGNLSLYPNPAKSILNLTIDQKSAQTTTFSIAITNSSGYVVKKTTSKQPDWQGNVSDLMPGTYIISVTDSKNDSLIGQVKFVKM